MPGRCEELAPLLASREEEPADDSPGCVPLVPGTTPWRSARYFALCLSSSFCRYIVPRRYDGDRKPVLLTLGIA
jgi:hypothetical protein